MRFSFLDISMSVCYACVECFLVVRNQSEVDRFGRDRYCEQMSNMSGQNGPGLRGDSLLIREKECYREVGGFDGIVLML